MGPTPVFWLGESHGQRSLAGYSSWGHKELDMTEQLSTMIGKKIKIHKETHAVPYGNTGHCSNVDFFLD